MSRNEKLTIEEILASPHFDTILLNFEKLYPVKRVLYLRYYMMMKNNLTRKAQQFCCLCRNYNLI